MIREWINKVDNLKVISFDIFDTLLFRCVKKPADLFEKVAQLARKKGYLNKYWSDCDFRNARIEAEDTFYREGVEPTLDGIYQRIPTICGDVIRIKEMELEVEKQNCYKNGELVQIMIDAAKQGLTVVLTSDMYLNSEQIAVLFENAKIPLNVVDQLFISCEKGMSKKDGGLFDAIKKHYQVDYRDILHIGDNSYSDVKMALEKGMHAYHYNVKEQENVSLMMDEIMLPNLLPELYYLRRWIAATLQIEDMSKKKWVLFGLNNIAPFFTYAMEWVLDVVEENDIHQIYSLMREGELYQSMLCQALKWRDYRVDVDLFYSSRNSMFLNQIDIINKEKLQSIYEDCCKEEVCVYGFFQLLQIEDVFPIDLECVKGEHLNLIDTKHRDMLINYLLEDNVISRIQSNINIHKENTRRYFDKMGMQKQRFATLDFGYKATVQSVIEKMIYDKDAFCESDNVHLLLLQSKNAISNINKCVNINGYLSMSTMENTPFEDGCRDGILETIQMRGEGCTIGYTLDGEPKLLEIVGIGAEQFQHIQWIHEGIMYFQRMALPLIHNCATLKQVKNKRAELYQLMCRCILYPTKEEADMITTLCHEDTFGNMLITKIMSYYECNCNNYREIFDIKYNGKYRPWHPGMVVQYNSLYYVERQISIAGVRGEVAIIESVKKALENEVKEVVIAGSGLAGDRMYGYCKLAGIKVLAFTDGNKKIQGTMKYGIPVIAISEVKENCNFLIASIKYKKQIQEEIEMQFGKNVKIF